MARCQLSATWLRNVHCRGLLLPLRLLCVFPPADASLAKPSPATGCLAGCAGVHDGSAWASTRLLLGPNGTRPTSCKPAMQI